MHILFVSNNFPPEVNALATRTYEHAKQWVSDGHTVDVVTDVPNYPEGKVYEGYKNRYMQERVEGINVTRVPMYVAENKGTLRRTLSYVSFMLSAFWFGRSLRRPDVIVASSPQFFSAIGGFGLARWMGVPFVLEVRDLWPESIVAVGAMERNGLIRLLERLEQYLYDQADHIVVVTNAFKQAITDKGIRPSKISVLKNGATLPFTDQPIDPAETSRLREEWGIPSDAFVASYVGTIGMAHNLDVLLDAAQRCADPDLFFLVAGAGARRSALENRLRQEPLDNVRLLEKQPRELVPYLLSLSHASVVHLRSTPLFKTVIPSKIFESMAMRRPIVLGVEGESAALIEEAGAGITVPPDEPDAIWQALVRLKRDAALYGAMAERGYAYVNRCHDRAKLARRYVDILKAVHAEPTRRTSYGPTTAPN
ncbi:MAG: glycosyltransferase family 4 protein [Bacteroidota bacterium]